MQSSVRRLLPSSARSSESRRFARPRALTQGQCSDARPFLLPHDAKGLEWFSLYMFDFGSPVGVRIAARHRE